MPIERRELHLVSGEVRWDEATFAAWFDAWWDAALDQNQATHLEEAMRRDPELRQRFQREIRWHHQLAHALVEATEPDVMWRRIVDTVSAFRRQSISEVVLTHAPRRTVWRKWLSLTVAAGLLLACGSAWWWQREPLSTGGPAVARVGLRVKAAEQVSTLRWDGETTTATLALGGELRIDAKEPKRVQLIRGQLDLAVAHQPAGVAYALVAGPATAEVIGTKLQLVHDPDRRESALRVFDGLVRWSDHRDQILVGAGMAGFADARGLWLHRRRQPIPGPELILDVPLPEGRNLLVGEAAELPAVRRLCEKNVAKVSDTGGPWPRTWLAQSWQLGSRGEIAIAPHPTDGTPSFQLRNLSGLPSVQLNMPTPVRLLPDTVYRFAFRYRSTGQCYPTFHIGLDQRWWNDSPIPLAEGRWRTVTVDLPVASQARDFRVTICNHAGGPMDLFAVSAIRLVALPLSAPPTGNRP